MKSRLNSRLRQVLWATVQHYINTAEPVGSKILVEVFRFDLSSASIRNAMHTLEDVGLLFQPHTSAGRVPSESGYRVYVDELLAPSAELSSQIQALVLEKIGEELHRDLDHLLEHAAQVLSVLTGCVALITGPAGGQMFIRHIRMVPLSSTRVLLVVVPDSLQPRTLLVDLPSEIHSDDLDLLNNFLNTHLSNRKLQEVSMAEDGPLWQEFRQWSDFLRRLLTLIQTELVMPVGQVFVSGLGELVRKPEFSQPEHLHELVSLLEQERQQLGSLLLKEEAQSQRVSVRIGSENPLEPMHSCTLVSRTFSYQGATLGSVGVLGPTRLPYGRVIASVQATADHLSRTVFR